MRAGAVNRLRGMLSRRPSGTLAAAAREVALVERCAAATLAMPPLPDPHRHPFAGWRSEAAEIRRWRLRQVVLDRVTMMLLHRGQVLTETTYLQPPEAVAALRVDAAMLRHDAPARTVICCDHWDTNHYHWLMHGAVMLHANAALPPGRRATPLLPRSGGIVDETLGLLDLTPGFVAPRPHAYALACVDYYDYGRGRADFAVSSVSQAALDALAASVPAAAERRLYIDRSGGGNRALANEAELIAALRARGFAILRLETLPLARQIALFKGAAVVVAAHGAGLTNIGFCRPGAFVYELVPSHYRNPCFVRMAMQAGLGYWADRFESGADPAGGHTAKWSHPIDVAAVLARIAQIEALRPV